MENVMIRQAVIVVVSILLTSNTVAAQPDEYIPDRQSVLRLIRNDKLDLVLPGAMRNNNIDMWIHVGRDGDPNPLEYEFGNIDGYLIFTDFGNRVERAMFGGIFTGSGAVENIDIHGPVEIARAIAGYDHGNVDPAVYEELREFVAQRDPQTIAVNFSDWLAVADGISYTQFRKLQEILGPELSSRIVSAENLVTDFRSTRILREVVVQANTLEIARQNAMKAVSQIVPGKTTIGECQCDARIYYSARSERTREPMATAWIRHAGYVFQPGDFFAFGGDAKWMDFGHATYCVDTKNHSNILRDGETSVPDYLQYAWDQTKKAQGIIRQNVKVGMTAGESLQSIITALEKSAYIYTPFTDDPVDDYRMIQKALKNTDKSGFYVDLHAMGNNGGTLVTVGPSMAPFRRDRDHLVIRENHLFAFEFAVHTNLSERPDYPITINFSNPQAVTNLGVEWIQPSNDNIVLIR